MKIEVGHGIRRRVWFTSDTHYAHSNICRATTQWTGSDNLTRDFKSLDHMNDTLVNNINEIVHQDDILIHLGDWSFGGFDLGFERAGFKTSNLCNLSYRDTC